MTILVRQEKDYTPVRYHSKVHWHSILDPCENQVENQDLILDCCVSILHTRFLWDSSNRNCLCLVLSSSLSTLYTQDNKIKGLYEPLSWRFLHYQLETWQSLKCYRGGWGLQSILDGCVLQRLLSKNVYGSGTLRYIHVYTSAVWNWLMKDTIILHLLL